MTKIEPVGYIYTQHNISSGAITDHAIPNGTALYTSFQMRQLAEACAVAAWNTGMSLHMNRHDAIEVGARCAGEIRNLIKEMLG